MGTIYRNDLWAWMEFMGIIYEHDLQEYAVQLMVPQMISLGVNYNERSKNCHGTCDKLRIVYIVQSRILIQYNRSSLSDTIEFPCLAKYII
jgi:hypothetical protein